MNENTNLGIIILTCNRPERIKYYVDQYANQYAKYGIDLIIYDSSDNDETKIIVEQCIKEGNNYIKYVFYNGLYDGKSLDHKVIEAYKEFASSYDYIWLCRDGLLINYDGIYKKFNRILQQGPDMIVVDYFLRTSAQRHQIIEYDNCQDLLEDQCIRMVTLGTLILSSKIAMAMVNNCPISEKNYTLWQAIAPFQYLADKDVRAVAFYDEVFRYHPIEIRSSFWNKSGNAVWQWGERWYTVINQLPSVYDSVKDKLYKIKMYDFEPFGINQLFIMKSNGGLSFSQLWRNRRYLRYTTKTPIWMMLLVAAVPISHTFIKNLFENEKYPSVKKVLQSCKKVILDEDEKAFFKINPIKLKMRLMYPSSRSFHTRMGVIENQVNYNNMQVRKIEKEVECIKHQNEIFFYLLNQKNGENLQATKTRIFHDLPIYNQGMKNIQIVLKDMLQDFISICENNGLQYWLWGRSLLGAIRHEKFIPWDDNLDIAMSRSDFDKLKKIVNDEEGKYCIRYYYNIGHGGNTIARVPRIYNMSVEFPLFINIFPFDGINISNKNDATYVYDKKRISLEKEILKVMSKRYIPEAEDSLVESWVEELLNPIFDKYIEDDKGDAIYMRWGLELHHADIGFMPRTQVFNLKKHIFENLEINVPAQAKSCLTMMYGNYYQIPTDAYRMAEADSCVFQKFSEQISEYVKSHNLQ